MKKKLANKIKKIKKKEDIAKILNIILADNPSYMENSNGLFMFFHQLEDSTYEKISIELTSINKKRHLFSDSSVNSESFSEKTEYTPYAKDEFPSQQGISPKLKYSNREKSLIKRRRYDKNINQDVDSEIVYTSFGVHTDTQHTSDSEKKS